MKTLILSGLAFVIVSAVVLAQTGNLTGQWKGETKSGTTLELNLTATSTTLTGTMLRRDEVIKLTDGKVQGKTFTFKATINEETAGFTGELDGDQISVWMDRQGRQAAAILKRVKQSVLDRDLCVREITQVSAGLLLPGRPVARNRPAAD